MEPPSESALLQGVLDRDSGALLILPPSKVGAGRIKSEKGALTEGA